jgi:hypothetical protein
VLLTLTTRVRAPAPTLQQIASRLTDADPFRNWGHALGDRPSPATETAVGEPIDGGLGIAPQILPSVLPFQPGFAWYFVAHFGRKSLATNESMGRLSGSWAAENREVTGAQRTTGHLRKLLQRKTFCEYPFQTHSLGKVGCPFVFKVEFPDRTLASRSLRTIVLWRIDRKVNAARVQGS